MDKVEWVSSERAWVDPELLAVLRLVEQGNVEPGWQLLVAIRHDQQQRSPQLSRLVRAAIAHRDQFSQLAASAPENAELALWLGTTQINHGWQVRTVSAPRASAGSSSRSSGSSWWRAPAAGPGHPTAPQRPAVVEPTAMAWPGPPGGTRRTGRGLGRLVKRAPRHYTGHYSRARVLCMLCAKWQGSNEQLLDFTTTA